MFSQTFEEYIQYKRMETQLSLDNQTSANYKATSHYTTLRVHSVFHPIMEPLLKWMHTGNLVLKTDQVRLFLHAIKILKINNSEAVAKDLCIAIGRDVILKLNVKSYTRNEMLQKPGFLKIGFPEARAS